MIRLGSINVYGNNKKYLATNLLFLGKSKLFLSIRTSQSELEWIVIEKNKTLRIDMVERRVRVDRSGAFRNESGPIYEPEWSRVKRNDLETWLVEEGVTKGGLKQIRLTRS